MVGKETITTTAGTFDCFVITSGHESKMGLKFSNTSKHWLANGVGMVYSSWIKTKKEMWSVDAYLLYLRSNHLAVVTLIIYWGNGRKNHLERKPVSMYKFWCFSELHLYNHDTFCHLEVAKTKPWFFKIKNERILVRLRNMNTSTF